MSSGPTSGSSTSRRSNSRTAITSWRWVSRFSGRSQPGALMKSEMTKTQRAALDRLLAGLEQRREIGERRRRQSRLLEQVVDQPQDLDPTAACRDGPFHLAPVEDRPDAVAAARQESRKRRDEVDQHAALEPLALDRAEVDRRAEVEQEPRGDLAVLDVLRGRTASIVRAVTFQSM